MGMLEKSWILQTNFESFVPSVHWPDYVSNLSSL